MENSQNEVHEANDTSNNNVAEISEVKQGCGDVRISIKRKLELLPAVNTKCNIYRVPRLLCTMNKTAYAPQVISIGPFHNDTKDLIATEHYKLQGVNNFLRRLDLKELESLKELMKNAQSNWVEIARNCYVEPIKMTDEDFVTMMLVDGCFIVELFILVHDQYTSSIDGKFRQIHHNVDLLFYQGIIPDVYFDLIKLENQLPFFVLQHLFDLIPEKDIPKSPKPGDDSSTISFLELTFEALRLGWVENYVQLGEGIVFCGVKPAHLLDFLRFYYISSSCDEYSEKNISSCSRGSFCHLLNKKPREESNDQQKKTYSSFKQTDAKDYYWRKATTNFLSWFCFSLCRRRNKKQHEENSEENRLIPPSITELREAGVTIKKAKNSPFITNISFKNGVLEISPIVVDCYFETMTRNLIAFEHLDAKNYHNMFVISYVLFMDYLINTEKDVSLLVKAGIIINDIGGSDKEVSELFNNLGKFVNRSGNTNAYFKKFNGISKDLCEHRDRRWNKLKASLKHNYFNTPWAGISVFAATFIILLTLLQTIFSGISTF